MIVRPVKKEEADAVAQLWLELVDYHIGLDDALPIPSDDGVYRYAQRIRMSVLDDYVQVYVAEQDGEIVGYVMGLIIDLLPDTFLSERAGLVADIYVRSDVRGSGVGKSLMKLIKDWFRGRGVSHYELSVAAANERGQRFWREAMHTRPVMMRMRASLEDDL